MQAVREYCRSINVRGSLNLAIIQRYFLFYLFICRLKLIFNLNARLYIKRTLINATSNVVHCKSLLLQSYHYCIGILTHLRCENAKLYGR